MSFYNKVKETLLVGLILLAGGCETSMNSVERAESVGQRQMVNDKRFLTDPSLSRKVAIVGVNEAVNAGGFLQVQVEVRNLTRSRQQFNYRFQWFDGSGMLVNTPLSAGMTSASIEGGESKFLSGTAPTQSSKDFRIQFIESSN